MKLLLNGQFLFLRSTTLYKYWGALILTDTSLSGTTVISLNGNYTLLKKHSISLQIRYTSRKGNADLRQKGFKEISGGVNYSWQFLK